MRGGRSDRALPGASPWTVRLLFGGVSGALLLFFTASAEGFGLPKLAALAAGAAAAWGALLKEHGSGRLLRRATPLDAPLAACALVFLAALAASPDRFLGMVGVYSLYSDGLFAFSLCASVFLAAACSDLPERPEAAADLLAACSGLAGAYAVLQVAGLDPFASFRPLPNGRAGSTLGDPVLLGAVLAGGLPAALAAAAAAAPRRRVLGRAAALSVMGGLLACGSRGAVLSAAVGAFCWAMLAFAGRPALRRRIVAAALVGLALGGAWTLRRDTGRSDSARLALWRCIPAIVKENPLLGAGPARFQAAMRKHRGPDFVRILGARTTQVHAHNDLFQAAATTGMLGLAAYLWLQWGALVMVRSALAAADVRPAAAAAAGCLAALFFQAKVNPLPLGAWAMAALILGSLASGSRRRLPGAAPALGTAAAGAVLLFSLRLCAADMRFAEARRAASSGRGREAAAAFEGALSANPWENFYRLEYSRLLYASAQRAAGPDKGSLLERAAAQGAAAAALRPAEADGWAMSGAYLIAWRMAGGPDRLGEAAEALGAAHRLDPYAPAVNDNLKLLEGMAARSP